ncbi:hypothetical protein C7974DRAFT_432675 [Boeremia exigua]|uniref:uncharacterized protein n=1 Tax=Boeremia exigua TaxID=749465 RepID=UPI001E8E7B8C|nr:uncharacterized protein C7974DRAFT_432675 [Boeremia exigua]KAH6637858.1 hypothetical protein C7974DRAFT_432675 [Boeremia exigua]
MALKDLLKKKEKIKDEGATGAPAAPPALSPSVPEFHFFRTTTSTHEAIEPPSFPGDPTRADAPLLSPKDARGFARFRRASHTSATSPQPSPRTSDDAARPRSGTLGARLLGRSKSHTSINVPANLPDLSDAPVARTPEDEARWEKRATVLVQSGPLAASAHSAPPTPTIEISADMAALGMSPAPVSPRPGVQRNPSTGAVADETEIQEAIRLHEKGNLEASTALFGRLADPAGPNNALAQVLYGLALRHAWGIDADQTQAVHFLSLAASNSAQVEQIALSAGLKGGSAKGELVLAMYELANCFRNGWGVAKDPAAARAYYETAANLGDADAMNEVAWCYVEGFGAKKDKVRVHVASSRVSKQAGRAFSGVASTARSRTHTACSRTHASRPGIFKAAQFLRLAESKGNKTLGNTW